jgi:hypothetical protein
MRTFAFVSTAILALGVVSAPSAQAAYTMTFQEVGGNVVEMGSGSLDTTDLNDDGSPFSEVAAVSPTGGQVFSGSTSSTPVEFFTGVSGPISFGPGIETVASSSSGDFVGLEGTAKASSLLRSVSLSGRCRKLRPMLAQPSLRLD